MSLSQMHAKRSERTNFGSGYFAGREVLKCNNHECHFTRPHKLRLQEGTSRLSRPRVQRGLARVQLPDLEALCPGIQKLFDDQKLDEEIDWWGTNKIPKKDLLQGALWRCSFPAPDRLRFHLWRLPVRRRHRAPW